MADRREIRRLKKEFEKLIKNIGIDNLSDPTIIEKSLELERELHSYFSEYHSMLKADLIR